MVRFTVLRLRQDAGAVRRKTEEGPEAPGRPAADLTEAARKMILASLEHAEKVDAA